MWSSLSNPGSFPTIFAGTNNNSSVPGICIRWQWVATGGFDQSITPVLSGMEIEESYYTCLDVASKYYRVIPKGILIHREDRELLLTNHYKIYGSSLGLPFLIGLISYINKIPWPSRTVSWGDIRPIRNNSFALYPVDNLSDKILVLRKLQAKHLIHPESEELNLDEITVTGISFEIEKAVIELNHEILVEGG